MSTDASVTPIHEPAPSTSVRHFVLAIATVMSVLLYLDRFAVGISSEYIREDLQMTQTQMAWFISAFFWAYALCQVPAGWLSDRFGPRIMLTIYILAWSAFTGLMGLSHAVWLMLWLRLFCGAAQAGAYPTSVVLIRHWYPVSFRGTASSIVALGGRFGGVLAPILTAWLIVCFVSGKPAPLLNDSDILDGQALMARFDAERPLESKRDLDVARHQFVVEFVATLPASLRETLSSASREADKVIKERAAAKRKNPQSMLDLRDWLPRDEASRETRDRSKPEGLDNIVEALSTRMSKTDFIDLSATPLKLPKQAKAMADRRTDGAELTNDETIRLNRFVLEALFPAEIRKAQGPGWRPTIIIYGIFGIIVALVFAVVTRNSPRQHRWCNNAERNLIQDEASQKATSLEPQNPSFPIRAFLTNISLWGNSLTQFLTNFGWFFVVSSLPRYLTEVHEVPFVLNGVMTAFPSGIGIFGLFLGGRCTDWATRRFGLKWGRRLPLAMSRFTGASGYGLCLLLSLLVAPDPGKTWLPWLYIVGLCIAAASTDFGTPAIWAYAQDVGGRYTASILGWGNMWGNLGAAVAPLIYNKCLGEHPTIENWNSVFIACCAAFFIAGFLALLVDATKPLTVQRSTT